MVMSKLVSFFSLSNILEPCSDYFLSHLCHLRGINRDITICLNGGKPPPKYVSRINMSLMNSNSANMDPSK